MTQGQCIAGGHHVMNCGVRGLMGTGGGWMGLSQWDTPVPPSQTLPTERRLAS